MLRGSIRTAGRMTAGVFRAHSAIPEMAGLRDVELATRGEEGESSPRHFGPTHSARELSWGAQVLAHSGRCFRHSTDESCQAR